jgi:hypothetical protein
LKTRRAEGTENARQAPGAHRTASLETPDEAQSHLAEHERFLDSMLDFIPGMVACWNADLVCAYANAGHIA